MAKIEIEIDGKMVRAKPGEMLISVTDREGISVPRFCYHKKLSVAASCRMCLVDVEGAPKPQPACSTPISEGMKIHTQNEKSKSSQKAVMEFLLINHPLDCPICDQGGECELQDVAVEYGSDVSCFSEGKRIVADNDIGPLIQTDMTRCIHCTRCVRFGAEIAGMMEMGGTGRGDHLKIEPFLTEGVTSELSGNMIDVCPVGALTSKPFRYELRSWQMNSTSTIARHDLVGSNINAQTYKGNVKRVVSGDNDAVNETWISDRDRFSYEGLSHENRLLEPQIKIEGQWKEVGWHVALDYAVKGLTSNILNNHQSDQLGVMASKTSTVEEFYLLQKIAREIGSENIDYRLNIKNLDNTAKLESNIKLGGLEGVDHALIVGSNPRLEQPMINHRLRKASLNGTSVDVINSMKFDFNYQLNSENIIAPNQIALTLAGVLSSVLASVSIELPDYLQSIKVSKESASIAEKLNNSDNSVIVLGEHIVNAENSATIVNLIAQIAKHTNSTTLNLSTTANSLAAELTGFVPGSKGMNANAMFESDLQAYILLDIYPEYDFHHADKAIDALNDKDNFVISLNSFKNDIVSEYSDVILPIAAFYETSGTHININGDMQSFAASVSAPDESKPAWKVFKVLADLLKLPGFNYVDSAQIKEEVSHQVHNNHSHNENIDLSGTSDNINIIWQQSPYSIDALLRHSGSLQQTKIGKLNVAYMNASVAKDLGVSADSKYLGVPVVITDAVADRCVFVNANKATQTGGES